MVAGGNFISYCNTQHIILNKKKKTVGGYFSTENICDNSAYVRYEHLMKNIS